MKLFTNNPLSNQGPKVVATALFIALACSDALAVTSAYWRHEEGPSGGFIPSGLGTVLDSSGNGNPMRTWDPTFTSATYSSSVSPLSLRSSLPNTLSLDFGPGGDDPGQNDDNYSEDAPINTQLFTAMTVELAFSMHAVTGWQALFGKDGKPLGDEVGEPDSPLAPFEIKIRGDDFPDAVPNQLFVEWIDGDGDIHYLSSGATTLADQWYHVAFTLTATSAELWVAGETGDYVLKDAISGEDFAGALGPGEVIIFDPTNFSVGRGMYNNNVTDWSNGLIDEVRVSDTALLPTEFLFVTVPGGTPGDFDGDSDVDGSDFLTWQRDTNVGSLSDWQNNYGTPLMAASQAVPEPGTWTLLLGSIGVGAVLRSRKNR